MTLRVSVVVPTFKRPDLLEKCLAALLAQNFPSTEYEIIVVDDATCDETRQQVEHLAKRVEDSGHTLRYIAATGNDCTHGPAATRNIGWRAAAGEIIAFTDDDCIPERNWLKAGTTALVDGVVGVSGRVLVPLPQAPIMPTDYEYNASHLEQSEFVTASCFYLRSALTMVDGFDERFTAPWREDSDLFFTLLEHNARCTVVPEAIVIHPVRPTRWGISLQQQRKSMFNALLYKKHPMLYRQKIQAAPPWHYYGIVATLPVILLGILKRSKLLTLGGLCMWLSLSGQFCVQRLKQTSRTPQHIAEMIVTSVLIPPLAVFWRLRGAIKFRVFFF